MNSTVLMKRVIECLSALVAMIGLVVSASGSNYTYTTLHEFGNGTDGQYPQFAGVTVDSSGNLYGTTKWGGTNHDGIVYKIDPSGNETVLYNFTCGNDGGAPFGMLMMDSSGNLYGTAHFGGSTPCSGSPPSGGYGTVWELNPTTGAFTTLYNFTGGNDGANPDASVIMDTNGNLYGTAVGGGAGGAGTVWELNPTTGTFTMLYSFTSATDGANPNGGLIWDTKGNLYGTANAGGTTGNGTVWELNPTTQTFTVLYSFSGPPDGGQPYGDLVMDSSGNLYGTCNVNGAGGAGTVFELVNSSGSYTENVLHNFTGGSNDGAYPDYGLVMDLSGNLYGTTWNGGTANVGVVYEVTPSGSETVLQSFPGDPDAAKSQSALTFNSTYTTLYGTTTHGGANDEGTVFEILSQAPAVTFSPTSVSFGNQGIGMPSAPKTVTLTNTGTGNLTFGAGAVTISGTNAADFAIAGDSCSGQTIGFTAPNNTCSVSVDFTPSTAAGESASLNFADNATGSPQTVTLSGTGVQPTATVSPNSLTFSGQIVNTSSAAQTVTLTNTGSTALTISSIRSSLAAFAETDNCGTSLAASSNCTINVTFSPSASGQVVGTLSIADSSVTSPQTVALTGTGQDFSLAASVPSRNIMVGGTATYPLTVAPLGGFNATVELACSGAPLESSCTVSPGLVTLDGTHSTAVAVTVSTTAGSMTLPPGPNLPPFAPTGLWIGLAGLAGLAMLVRFGPKHGKARLALLTPLAVLLLAATFAASCGSSGTPSGTYPLTITAKSGAVGRSLTHTVSLNLTVN